MLRILKIVAINFAVLASLVLVAAIALEIYLRLGDTRMGTIDKRRAGVPNYAGATWPEVHFREVEELETVYFSFVEWRRGLFAGETINVVGPFHERLTPVAEGAQGGAVFFFGGSTMWGTGSRDFETIPAAYGRIAGRPTRNFGESGYIAHQNLEMLQWVMQEGEAADAVVFYDGVNDVMHKCRSGLPAFSHGQADRMRLLLEQHHGFFERIWPPIQMRLAQLDGQETVDARFDCDDDPAKAREVADAMIRDWKLGRLIAEAGGMAFFPVLQPVVYFSQSLADRRADVTRAVDAERRLQFEAVYPLVRAQLAAVGAIDLSQALDGQEYFFVDFCHLSPNGNERVAQALAAIIEPQLR